MKFIDLHVYPEALDENGLKVLRVTKTKVIAVEAGTVGGEASLSAQGVKVLRRITLASASLGEAKRMLRGIRNFYEIVAIEPLSMDVARLAARDGRVDLVRLTMRSSKFFDKHELNMLEQSGIGIELPLKELSKLRPRFLRKVRAVVSEAWRRSIPVVVVSSAKRWVELWHPITSASLLAAILGVDRYRALAAMSMDASRILARRHLA